MSFPPNTTNTAAKTPEFSTMATSGFVPTVAPAGTVRVMVMQSNADQGSGVTSDPRQSRKNADGTIGGKRDQVLLDLVGVVFTEKGADGKDIQVAYPGAPLPPLNSPEYLTLMARKTGLKVKSLFGDGIASLLESLKAGPIPGIPFGYDELSYHMNPNNRDASLNDLFRNMGGLMEDLGLVTTHEWTIGDIIAGQKTCSISLLAPGLAKAYVDSFGALQATLQFRNVVFVVEVGDTVSVTELGTSLTYSFSEIHFHWAEAPNPMGRGGKVWRIDPRFAFSGQKFSTAVVGSIASATDLSRASASRGSQGRIDYRNNKRDQQEALKSGARTPAVDVSQIF
jgi:hypothetical protein